MKKTKHALLLSAVSMLLCLSMLVGSTFAWFTDTASTGVNKIVAGNLDVELEYSSNGTDWESVPDTSLFSDNLWEPGHTEFVRLRVRNAGSLALKYQLSVNVYGDAEGNTAEATYTNIKGENFKLSEHLVFNKLPINTDVTKRENLWLSGDEEKAAMGNFAGIGGSGNLASGISEEFVLAVYMPTWVGNEANYRGEVAPEIYLGITVNAVQDTVENDSFGNDYDAGATFPNERLATNDAELAEALADKDVDTIYLNGNFGATTLPVGTNGVSLIAKNGAAMESLNINGAKNVVIDGLTFDAANAVQTHVNKANGEATNYTASVYEDRTVANNAAMNACENVTIKNCTFSGIATVDGETGYTAINFNDGGAGTRSANITVEGCKFNCNAVSYIYIQYVDEDSYVTITNNTFGGTGYSIAWAAVAVQQLNNVDVKITNNTFNSWDAADGAVKVSKKSGSATTPTATITGNTFNGAVADNSTVIEIRRAGNTGHTISGNTYNITDITLTDESVEARTDNNDPSTAVAIWYRQYNG